MGKKILRKGYGKSKGIHSTMDRGIVQALRATRDPLVKALNKQAAWKKGLNPWLTVATNPRPDGKNNMPFVRVRANDYWGKPQGGYMIGGQKEAA